MTIDTYRAWRRRVASAKYRAANREKANAAQAAYRASSTKPRQWEKDNPGNALAIKRAWRKRHPAAVRAINAARRVLARKQRCTCCTNAEIVYIYEIAALVGAEVDHTRPLAAGGPHCVKNLRPLSVEEHKEKTRTDRAIISAYRLRQASPSSPPEFLGAESPIFALTRVRGT